jgi:hypothetical protein
MSAAKRPRQRKTDAAVERIPCRAVVDAALLGN